MRLAVFHFVLGAFVLGPTLSAASAVAQVDEPVPVAAASTSEVDAGVFLPFQLKLAAGYALRLSPDGRTSGGGAVAQVDIPVWGAFGTRVGALGMGFAGSTSDPRPLAFGGAHASLLYAVDEGDIAGRLHVGGLAGYTSEFDFKGAYAELPQRDGIYAGALLGIDLQWQLSTSTALSVGAELPIFLLDPEGFTVRAPFGTDEGGLWMFQGLVHVGLTFEPILFIEGLASGHSLVDVLLPSELPW